MKKIFERIVAGVLVFGLTLSICTSDISSAKNRKKGTWGPNMTWELKGSAKKHNQTLYITCNGKMASLDCLGSPNREYWNSDAIKKVVVRGNTTSLGEGAFDGLVRIESVDLSDSLEYIGSSAFAFTEKLKYIVLPKRIKKIGEGAFTCSGITSIIVPKGVKKIKADTFYCSNLTSIQFAGNIEEIGKRAFYACDKLNRLKLDNSTKKIKERAFVATNLKRIVLPKKVESIDYAAFAYTDISKVVIKSKRIKHFGNKVFYRKGDKKLTIVVPGKKYNEYKKMLVEKKCIPKNTEIIAKKM